MNYLIIDDFLKVIDQDTLNDVIENDITKLDTAEETAIDEMAGYLNVRYNIEEIFNLQNKKALISMYMVDICLYHLHTRITPDNIPEIREKRYTNARDWLEKVADGFTNPTLPSKPEDEKTPLRYGNSAPKQNHYY